MSNWIKCDWLIETNKRPTVPGIYRVLISGNSESEDGHTLWGYPDYGTWGTLYPPEPEYISVDAFTFGDVKIDESKKPYQSMDCTNAEEDNIIAWYGPIVVPDEEFWKECQWTETPETRPVKLGLYIGKFSGDSEYLEGHCIYDFSDYTSFFTIGQMDQDGEVDFKATFDEEPDWLLSWSGPFEIPDVDCFDE